jgi:hypothetical protein
LHRTGLRFPGKGAKGYLLGQSQWRVSPSGFPRCEILVWNRCLPQCIVSLHSFIGSRVPQPLSHCMV